MIKFNFDTQTIVSGTNFNFGNGFLFHFTDDNLFPGADYTFIFGHAGYTIESLYILSGAVNEFTNVWYLNPISCDTGEYIYVTTNSGLQIISKKGDTFKVVLTEQGTNVYIDICTF